MKRSKKSNRDSNASSIGSSTGAPHHQQGDLEPEYDIDIEDVEGDDDEISSPKWQLPNHS